MQSQPIHATWCSVQPCTTRPQPPSGYSRPCCVQPPDAEAHKLLDVGLKLAALDGLAAASSLAVSTSSSLLLNNLTPQLPAGADKTAQVLTKGRGRERLETHIDASFVGRMPQTAGTHGFTSTRPACKSRHKQFVHSLAKQKPCLAPSYVCYRVCHC